MVLRNVRYVKVKDMTAQQKKEHSIEDDIGLVAIETHNHVYNQKSIKIKDGIVDYILSGD